MLVYLILGGEFYGSGGWAKYVRELAHFLTSRSHRVKIICRMGKTFPDNAKIDVKLQSEIRSKRKRVPLSYWMAHLPNPLTAALGTIRLAREIRRDGGFPKVVHAHDLFSSFLIAFFIGKLLKVPYIIQIHGFPLREWEIKLMRAGPVFGNFIWFLTKMLHTIAVRLIKNGSTLVLINNNEVKSFYESYGISSNKLEVVPSAINLQEHERHLLPRKEAGQRLGLAELEDVTVGYIGGLKPEKNVETLVKAFREFMKSCPRAKARLIIIGDGPTRPILEEYVKKHGIDGCTFFLGYIPNAYRFLNAIDIFVLPSLSEGSPFSLIEAMVAGKAIIASNIPATREMVEDGKEALLFDPHNPQQLKSLILTLYNNPKLREKLGENARRKAKQYDVNVIFPKILQIYKRVLGSLANSN